MAILLTGMKQYEGISMDTFNSISIFGKTVFTVDL